MRNFYNGQTPILITYDMLLNLAPLYSSTKTYLIGDYVIYEGELYSCAIDILDPEEWNESKWNKVKISNDLNDLNYLKNYFVQTAELDLQSGSLASNGAHSDILTRIRTKNGSSKIKKVKKGDYYEIFPPYKMKVAIYNTNILVSGNFFAWVNTDFVDGKVFIPDEYIGKYAVIVIEKIGYESDDISADLENIDAHVRYYNNKDFINNAFILNGGSENIIRVEENTDYNDLLIPGSYLCAGTTIAATIINKPSGLTLGHLLYVIRTTSNSRLLQIILVSGAKCDVYIRWYNGTWSDWGLFAKVKDIETANNKIYSLANGSRDGLKLFNTIIKCTNVSYTALSEVSDYIQEGGTYTGIPYDNRFAASNDALFNFSLEAVYSMFNNPESIIYTQEIHDAGEERVAPVGAVCSSVACWITGQPIVYTTYDIIKMLDYKEIVDLSDLELGDVIICHHNLNAGNSDHAAVISNIYSSDSEITFIKIFEAWGSGAREVTYTPEQFWGLLDGTTRGGDIYKVGRFPNTQIKTVPSLVVNTDIISERGDNIWYNQGDDIYIQSKQDSFTVVSPSGIEYPVTFSSLTSKGAMGNIGSILNDEIGRWTLNGSNNQKSHITIVNTGNASLTVSDSVGTVTLSGYEGCTPCGFITIRINTGTSTGSYDTHMDGNYSAGRYGIVDKNDYRYSGPVTSDTFTINLSGVSSGVVGVYIRIFYETGCGQAWKDTNVILREDF